MTQHLTFSLVSCPIKDPAIVSRLLEFLPRPIPSTLFETQKSLFPVKNVAILGFNEGSLVSFLACIYYPSEKMALIKGSHFSPHYPLDKLLLGQLELLESFLKKEGALTLSWQIEEELPLLNAVLTHRKWSAKEPIILKLKFDSFTFNPPWLSKEFPLKETQIFPWRDLTNEERAALKKQCQAGIIPPYFSPLRDESSIDPVTSYGLKLSEEIVGWSLCHLLSPDTLLYAQLFVAPRFRNSGVGISLLKQSIFSQQNRFLPEKTPQWALFEVSLEKSPSRWIDFVHNHLLPYACFSTVVYRYWKAL